MFFNKKYKKIISIFLAITILVPSLFLSKPTPTDAYGVDSIGGPSGIVSAVLDGVRTGYDAASKAYTWAMKNKELVLDGIAWTAAKMVVQQMTSSIVNWINSGFEGGPAFVTDVEGFMTDIADNVAGEFINQSNLGFLCNSFDITLALETSYYGKDFENEYECTLTDVVNNVDNFVNGNNFSEGGWSGWFEMTTTGHNNPYSEILGAQAELGAKISGAQQEKKEVLAWADGFLSKEECEEYPDGTKKCKIVTPGSVIEDQLNKNLDSGRESLIAADEINEIISALLGQLITSVMSSDGLLGQGTSSYGDSEGDSEGSNNITSEIKDDINEMLDTEEEYNEIKNDSLDLVQEALDLLNDLVNCLNSTGETSKLNLANEFLNGSATIPQTDIDIDLNALKTSIQNDINDSSDLIDKLETLLDEASVATTIEELDNITNEYMNLYTEVHNLQDISDAEIELNGYGKIVDGLPNGLTYNIDLLINTFAENITTKKEKDGIEIYPPEEDKGIQQRYDECQVCNNNNNCVKEGEPVIN